MRYQTLTIGIFLLAGCSFNPASKTAASSPIKSCPVDSLQLDPGTATSAEASYTLTAEDPTKTLVAVIAAPRYGSSTPPPWPTGSLVCQSPTSVEALALILEHANGEQLKTPVAPSSPQLPDAAGCLSLEAAMKAAPDGTPLALVLGFDRVESSFEQLYAQTYTLGQQLDSDGKINPPQQAILAIAGALAHGPFSSVRVSYIADSSATTTTSPESPTGGAIILSPATFTAADLSGAPGHLFDLRQVLAKEKVEVRRDASGSLALQEQDDENASLTSVTLSVGNKTLAAGTDYVIRPWWVELLTDQGPAPVLTLVLHRTPRNFAGEGNDTPTVQSGCNGEGVSEDCVPTATPVDNNAASTASCAN